MAQRHGSQSSCAEVNYGSQEWHDKSQPALLSLSWSLARVSPASKKHVHDEFEEELDEITTDSNIISGPEGKTMDELDAIMAEYHCNVQASRLQAGMRQRALEANHLYCHRIPVS